MRRPKLKMTNIPISDLDVVVEPAVARVVIVNANFKGRKIVEELWPDVKWLRLDLEPADWHYTYLRITKLPAHLEKAVPLEFANSESLAFAVTWGIQAAEPSLRVALRTDEGMSMYPRKTRDLEAARELFAEYDRIEKLEKLIGAPARLM